MRRTLWPLAVAVGGLRGGPALEAAVEPGDDAQRPLRGGGILEVDRALHRKGHGPRRGQRVRVPVEPNVDIARVRPGGVRRVLRRLEVRAVRRHVQPARAVEVAEDGVELGLLPDRPERAVVVELHHAGRTVRWSRALWRPVLVNVQRVLVPCLGVRIVGTDERPHGCGSVGHQVARHGVRDDEVPIRVPARVLGLGQRRQRPVPHGPDVRRARHGRRHLPRDGAIIAEQRVKV